MVKQKILGLIYDPQLNCMHDEIFVKLLGLLKSIADVPYCFFNLVAEDHIYVKYALGLSPGSTLPLDPGLCTTSFKSKGIHVVENTLKTISCRKNALVTGPPNLQFYSAIRIHANHIPIGTLGVADTKPRKPHNQLLDTLNHIGGIVEETINKGLQMRLSAESNVKTHNLLINALNATREAILVVDKFLSVQYFNDSAQDLNRVLNKAPIFTGANILKYFSGNTQSLFKTYYQKAFQGHSFTFETNAGKKDLLISLAPIFNKNHEVISIAHTIIDITEHKKREEQLKRTGSVIKQLAWEHSHSIRKPICNLLGLMEIKDFDKVSSAQFNQHFQKSMQELNASSQHFAEVLNKFEKGN